jgi:hypothetical protein
MQRSRLQSARSPLILELYAYRLSATHHLYYTPNSGPEFPAGVIRDAMTNTNIVQQMTSNKKKHPKIDVEPALTGVSRSNNCETYKRRGRNIFSTGPKSNEVMIR